MGYLFALSLGATEIIDTDDDNLPIHNYEFPPSVFAGDVVREGEHAWINVYSHFTDEKIWPRGLPLTEILRSSVPSDRLTKQTSRVGIWQGLANGDPDVDSLFRLIFGRLVEFQHRDPIVLAEGVLSPFNSQNTWFHGDLFPLLYLPITVGFRYTDILLSIVAQPIMWAAGFRLGFTRATVYQDRNEHDLFKDFLSEIPMFETVESAARICSETVNPNLGVTNNLMACYLALANNGVVERKEVHSVANWLKDIEGLGVR